MLREEIKQNHAILKAEKEEKGENKQRRNAISKCQL